MWFNLLCTNQGNTSSSLIAESLRLHWIYIHLKGKSRLITSRLLKFERMGCLIRNRCRNHWGGFASSHADSPRGGSSGSGYGCFSGVLLALCELHLQAQADKSAQIHTSGLTVDRLLLCPQHTCTSPQRCTQMQPASLSQ